MWKAARASPSRASACSTDVPEAYLGCFDGSTRCAPPPAPSVAAACARLALSRASRLPNLSFCSLSPLSFAQRHLEILLYQRFDGGSSGAIWKALNNSGLQSTSLNASRKAVDDGFLLEAELAQIISVFKLNLPVECCDPSQLGRIRSTTLLPLATAASVCRQYGRSTASMAWLRAFAQVSDPTPASCHSRFPPFAA